MTISFFEKLPEAVWSVGKPTFKAFTFPGGEPHISNIEESKPAKAQTALVTGSKNLSHDLFTLAMWSDVVRSRGERMNILLPYLPGARADRGVPFGAQIYANFINELQADVVVALDPHSPTIVGLIDNLRVVPVEKVMSKALGHEHDYAGVIAPDAGAVARATKAAEVLDVPVFFAEKHRDFSTGKLSGFSCQKLPTKGRFLLVDDICDGGGTFNGLADTLSSTQGVGLNRLDLWVTHGIFSQGILELQKRFQTIYTTSSRDEAKGINSPFVKVTYLGDWLHGAANV